MQEHTPSYLTELTHCELCEWRCGVDRLAGELGACRIGIPQVASTTLHPAPPSSYTIFLAGCNFRCLHCQNWSIAHYPDTNVAIHGWIDPDAVASDGIEQIRSLPGQLIGADRLFFSGGEPTCSLPSVEEIVRQARHIAPDTKVNFDTNGFMTEESLERILAFTTSITFDIRAVSDDVHRALTGAPSQPVLRNARIIAREAHDKLWEFRILLIPEINEEEVEAICAFIADLNPALPVCFLAFRPNFVLDAHRGAPRSLMQWAVRVAHKAGLRNVSWAGATGIYGSIPDGRNGRYQSTGAQIAGYYAERAGCITHPRDCGNCNRNQNCQLKRYTPFRST